MGFLVFFLFLLLPARVSAGGDFAAPAEVLEVLPGPYRGGKALGRGFFRVLEEEVLTLAPGPWLVEKEVREGLEEEASLGLEGLAEVLERRGFHPASHGGDGKGVLRLVFSAFPWGRGGYGFRLSCPGFLQEPLEVRILPAPWVYREDLPPGVFRAGGEWKGSPGEALASAREKARARVLSLLERSLPWRPWKGTFLGSLTLEGLERRSFLQRRNGPAGPAWKAWVLWNRDGKVLARARKGLGRADRTWLLRLGWAAAAALGAWLLALRLDWATKGYFTFRIQALSFLAWLGLCGAFWLVV